MLQGDPFKTLFVGRISYDATEKKLRREFEEYGPVKSIRLVNEKRSGAHPAFEVTSSTDSQNCRVCRYIRDFQISNLQKCLAIFLCW